MNAARTVGGDFYDFYFIDDDKLVVTIADVSGKGVPAALFMVTAKTLLKNFALKIKNPDEFNGAISLANDRLCEGNDQCMFVTVFSGILEISTGKFTYVNAGHNPPLLYKKSEQAYKYLTLAKTRKPLGIMEEMFFKSDSITFNSGDKIFLYTDGVTEAMDEKKNLFGQKALEDALNENISANVNETIEILNAKLANFVGNAEQSDDITMIVLEYFGEEKENG